jgi:hypothetical protein
MKRFLFFLCLLFPLVIHAQHHSWDGKGLSPMAKMRCLNIFVNIIYDIDTTVNVFEDSTYWPRINDTTLEGINNAAIPTYLLDWMDTVYVPGQLRGTCTRIFGESSFDSLQLIGEFIVVNIKESTILQNYAFNEWGITDAVCDFIQQKGFSTIYGHNQIIDYDYNQNNRIDYVNFLIRNISKSYGGLNLGNGHGSWHCTININGISYYNENGTIQCVGAGNFVINPTCVVIHEIGHSLFGDNDFHTSGGNHRGSTGTMPFLNIQFGYGLMGAAGASLVSCNGYDRWRMHWKHPQSIDYISAQNNTGLISIPSDVSKEDGNVSFVLRDFVTCGDAIRIKLPYKDSETSSNQYIWLENHQIRNDKLDFLQYSNTDDCRPQGKAGIYAYYQIGREVLESFNSSEIWDNYHRDNLKIIPAEGYYDYIRKDTSYHFGCVADGDVNYLIRRGNPNPFCGGQDQEDQFFPLESDSILYISRETAMWGKTFNNEYDGHLACLGDTLDAFIPPFKINMGTNPSTCNAKTYFSRNNQKNSGYIISSSTNMNTQTTYLTGLSIEMLRKGRSTILVNIRWDDYDITNDTRWTGNIALKDTAILTTPYSITLAQNRTVALPYRDTVTGLFAGRTQWICESGSYFRQDDSTHVYLTENSSLIFQSGSTYEQEEAAVMCVQAGCTLHVQDGANMLFMGTLEIDSGAVAILNGTVHFGNAARLIVRPGGVLIVNGGTLTSAGAGAMWQGVELVGDRTKHQEPQYQGTVELWNGAVIENAVTAIRTGLQGDNWHTTGGIIKATDAVFRNNQQAIEFLSYCDTVSGTSLRDNCSFFTRCVFTIGTDNLLAQNNLQFYNHVTMWDVKNVKFKGCTFENNIHLGKLCRFSHIESGMCSTNS